MSATPPPPPPSQLRMGGPNQPHLLPTLRANPKITFHRPTTGIGIGIGGGMKAAAGSNNNYYPTDPMEWEYATAMWLYRNRDYERCVEVCNGLLQTGHENNVQLFTVSPGGHADEQQQQQQQQHQWSTRGASNNNHNHNNNSGIRYSSNLQRISSGGATTLTGVDAGVAFRQQQASTTTATRTNAINIPTTWLMEGVWQLKMRALTQRVYIDDLETYDADAAVNQEIELGRMATAARPGSSLRTTFTAQAPRTGTAFSGSALGSRSNLRSGGERPSTSRPTSAMARPGTTSSRPGSALGGNRPGTRCGTASRVRSVSAAAFNIGDPTAMLFQAARLNPTIYAERPLLTKSLFQFLFYHEANVEKAFQLCEAVRDVAKQQRNKPTGTANKSHGNSSGNGNSKNITSTNTRISPTAGVDEWWWEQQIGRCLLTLCKPRLAEGHLQQSLAAFQHPDTYLLLSRVYLRLEKPEKALELISGAADRSPFNVIFRLEQGRIYDLMSKPDDAFQIYRLVSKLNPINIEALASIAMHYFYDNNPEMALMYYKRILSLGVHTSELYNNIGLCCLYSGQLDLVLPCFTRSTNLAITPEQKSDIWYNLSFVAITTGDFKLARRCLQLCLTGDSNNGAALNNLAVLYAYNGDLVKAKLYLASAKEVLTDCSELENNLKYMQQHYKL